MRLRSVGSARRRSTPEGADSRKTGWGRTSMVLLPPCAVGAAVRVVAPCEDMAAGFDMSCGVGISLGMGVAQSVPSSISCGTMGGAIDTQGPEEGTNRPNCVAWGLQKRVSNTSVCLLECRIQL
jgi:hypothetical protein